FRNADRRHTAAAVTARRTNGYTDQTAVRSGQGTGREGRDRSRSCIAPGGLRTRGARRARAWISDEDYRKPDFRRGREQGIPAECLLKLSESAPSPTRCRLARLRRSLWNGFRRTAS